MNEPVKTIIKDSILEVTIDRPKANAIDAKTSIILGEIFSNFRDDPNLKVAIITGAGEKFFSAGWDLKAVNEGEEEVNLRVTIFFAFGIIGFSCFLKNIGRVSSNFPTINSPPSISGTTPKFV